MILQMKSYLYYVNIQTKLALDKVDNDNDGNRDDKDDNHDKDRDDDDINTNNDKIGNSR